MTIAACYVSPEGVVLGADSTTTYDNGGSPHFFNHAQKLFEIGTDSTWGIVTWGLGGLVIHSHRTLVATLGTGLANDPVTSSDEIPQRWIDIFWPRYSESVFLKPHIDRCKALDQMLPFQKGAAPAVGVRSENEENEYFGLRNALSAGFCIAGYDLETRTPVAYELVFDPTQDAPAATKIETGFKFWGAPNMIQRLIYGYDDNVANAILQSGKWNGTAQDFLDVVEVHQLAHAYTIPIRDALDFVHASIYSTIKALKFSSLSQICGGPIELSVITTDRKFRWVRHKPWDAAITEGDP